MALHQKGFLLRSLLLESAFVDQGNWDFLRVFESIFRGATSERRWAAQRLPLLRVFAGPQQQHAGRLGQREGDDRIADRLVQRLSAHRTAALPIEVARHLG